MSKRFRNGEVDPSRMICAYCLKSDCSQCVNIPLIKWNLDPLCTCHRKEHADAVQAV